jgi:ATP-binding cassette subfamily B protein
MNPRLRKFLSYYKQYLGWLVADLACAVVVSAITVALPLCAGYITKTVLQTSAPQLVLVQIYGMGALMLALVVVHTVCNTFVDYQGHMMGTLMESDMRRELFAHLQKLPYRFYDQHKTGQLMTRITNDLLAISELYHHGPEDLAIALLKFIGAFSLLFSVNVELAVVVLLFFPPMVAYALHFNRKMNAALRATAERIGDINAQVEETLAGIRVVQSFTNEANEATKFDHANARFVHSRRAGYRSEAFFHEGMEAFAQLIVIVVMVFGGIAISQANLSAPDLVTFLLGVGILIDPIRRFANFARLVQEGRTGFERFIEIMDVQPEIQDAANAVDLVHVQGQIEFKNVTFKYQDDHDYVLEDISLKIRPGEFVALVGPSGVGKTTLCSLIPRFYEASAGAILLDNKPIKDIRLCALRKNIGVVQQDVYLFAGTVADNIRYGKLNATRAEIVAAAQQANAHDFIMALPNGYDTDIGQRGVKLSGGQKQRLSIARVFLKNPPVLILDEATSALDHESERAVRESLEKLTDNRTTLVIAHRLSTVRNAQRILVLTENGIEAQGTHEQLIGARGTYANLYNMHLSV